MASGTRPHFVPDDFDLESLPPGVRAAIEGILAPAYEELVLKAPPALERAAGNTFVHLLFQELIEQSDLGRQVADRTAAGEPGRSPREADLNRHLRLVAGKDRAAKFILQARAFRTRKRDPFAAPIEE